MESPPQLSRPHSHISNFNSRMPAATIITSENYPNNLLKFEDSLIDEREQRIIDFLGSQGVEFKNPMEKFYDYCENIRKEGCSVTSLKSKTSCNSITTEDNEKTPKKDNNQKSFVLSSTLYKKRKLGLNTIGSSQILNSFNQVNKLNASPIDNFLKISIAHEKAEIQPSYSDSIRRNFKRISFKDLEEPLEKPIPSFNADNKQKMAQMKLGNKQFKGILKKNPKYLIPNDIITQQIKKYEREFLLKDQEFKEIQDSPDQDRKALIESFYFPNEEQETEENIPKSIDLSFKYNIVDYEYKKPDNLSNKNVNETKKQQVYIKPVKNNVFTSIVNNILLENPFGKLKNKEENKRVSSPLDSKTPYYKEIPFVIPQNFEKKTEEKEKKQNDDFGLFNYDKKQNLKRIKLQNDWNFTEEENTFDNIESKKPFSKKKILSKTDSYQILPENSNDDTTDSKSFKRLDEIEIQSKLKQIESSYTPILKEWPKQVSYNFNTKISTKEEIIKNNIKEKEDSTLVTLSSQQNPEEMKEVDIEIKTQLNKLRYFFSDYFIGNDNYRKTELVFIMANKTIIKHDLIKFLWSYYQFEENILRVELFAICSYNNWIIIAGGIDPTYGEISKKTYIFNYEDKSLVEKSSMKTPRYKQLMFILKNTIYCIGGCTKGEIGIKNCEKYMIEEDKWVDIAPLKIKRSLIKGTISVLNNAIYILGGNDPDNNLILVIEKYDIINDIWGLINISNEFIISNQCKLIILHKKNYSEKVLDYILVFDKKESDYELDFESSLIDLENGVVEEKLEFKLNPSNYILLHQESFYIFPMDTFEKSDKLTLKNSFVENINFEFCL